MLPASRLSIVALALAALACGGGSEDGPLSKTVDGPPGSQWSSAVVERSSAEVAYGGRGGIGSRTVTEIALVLRQGDRALTLDLEDAPGFEVGDGPVELRFSSDATGIALLAPGSTSWRIAHLDMPVPLFCPHMPVGAASDDPFESAPAARAVVVDVLSGGDPPLPGSFHGPALVDGEPAGAVTFGEFNAAVEYACAHRDDKELMALFAGVARRGAPFPVADPGLGCMASVAREDPVVRDALIAAALGNVDGRSRRDQVAWAGRVLSQVADEPSQDALGRLLEQEMALARGAVSGTAPGEKPALDAVAELSRSLLAATQTRKAASEATERLVITLVTTDLCGSGPTCRSAQEDATNALVSLDALAHRRAEDAIAAALGVPGQCGAPGSGGNIIEQGPLAWSLARLVGERGVATPAAERALLGLTSRPAVCPGACEADCELARVEALLGLSASRSGKARAGLAAAALQPCKDEREVTLSAMAPDGALSRPLYVEAGEHEPGCWARAAILGR